LFSKLSTIRQQFLLSVITLMTKGMTSLCYGIFESCNGAQEVRRSGHTLTGGMDFGFG
jgi:hypothetical protein